MEEVLGLKEKKMRMPLTTKEISDFIDAKIDENEKWNYKSLKWEIIRKSREAKKQ